MPRILMAPMMLLSPIYLIRNIKHSKFHGSFFLRIFSGIYWVVEVFGVNIRPEELGY